MNICIFEDDKYEDLYPMTLTRPTCELKCGHTLLWEKIARAFPGVDIAFSVRDYIAPTFKRRTGGRAVNDLEGLAADDTLFINGRWLFDTQTRLDLEGPEEVGLCGGQIAYVRAKRGTISEIISRGVGAFLEDGKAKLSQKTVEAVLIDYPWDLIMGNPGAIEEDFKALNKSGIHGVVHPMAVILGDETNIYVSERAEIQPFVVLDATHGPILIDEGVTVFPNSRVEGPTCVGRDTQIVETNLREGCAIGPVCRVGGEVEESIIHGYSNKYHAGFLGHSYVGEWVNLGALTTNSDLKNDYSEVDLYIRGKLTKSGTNKLGSFIGDHTKTSIGALLSTGTVIGVMSNLLTAGEPMPKGIPSFVWYFRGKFSRGVGFKKTVETAATVMGRREIEQTQEDVDLLQVVHDLTQEERRAVLRRRRG